MRVSLVAVGCLAACGGHGKEAHGEGEVGRAAGAGLAAAVNATGAILEPWRCARMSDPANLIAPPGWALQGRALSRGHSGDVKIAFVHDARGASDDTV